MSVLLIQRSGGIKTIALNRPDRANTLSAELVHALHHAIDASARDGTRLLVIRGCGQSFCSGFDLADVENLADSTLAARSWGGEQATIAALKLQI